MGADQFNTRASGKTVNEAFAAAKEEALYESGHGGYTGTIAEKSSFKAVSLRTGETAEQAIERCLNDEDHWVQDKWGPAGYVEIGPDPSDAKKKIYCFFGWASS